MKDRWGSFGTSHVRMHVLVHSPVLAIVVILGLVAVALATVQSRQRAAANVDSDTCRDELAIGRYSTTNMRVTVRDDSTQSFAELSSFGSDWGSDAYATSVAFGNPDRDPLEELAIARYSTANMRVTVRDDQTKSFVELASFGSDWGSDAYATSVAFGNVDGDPRDELAIARFSPTNMRVTVRDDSLKAFAELASFGSDWGSDTYATSVAFGDVDGDGLDELAIARNSSANMRVSVRDDAVAGFGELKTFGSDWGSGAYATSVAFGDVDSDGKDELAIGRRTTTNMRVTLRDDAAKGFQEMASFGKDWGSGAYATAVAFGDIDGDFVDELAIARKTTTNMRVEIRDDARGKFAQLTTFGSDWGSAAYATAVAFGDVDGDQIDELAIGRFYSGSNMRVTLRDDSAGKYAELASFGQDWGEGAYATAVALRKDRPPNVDSDGDGLSDAWETNGVDVNCNGTIDLDLPGWGADPMHKDIFLEYDWMPGFAPTATEVAALKQAFSVAPIDAGGVRNPDGQPGINLWVDTGNLAAPGGALVGDNLGGGNQATRPAGCLDTAFYVVKAANFAPIRQPVFRYAISGDGLDSSACGGGRGEIGGNDFIEFNPNSPGTIMHELGHTLGLLHGGFENHNCKPNYVSVMNYDYQFGIPQSAISGLGQDFDANGVNEIIDYSPVRRQVGGRLVRSKAPLPNLIEADLDEPTILDPTDGSNQVLFKNGNGTLARNPLNQAPDWDGDGNDPPNETNLGVNIDTWDAVTNRPRKGCRNSTIDGRDKPLKGFDDWANISFSFRNSPDSADGAVNPELDRVPTIEELLENVRQQNLTDVRLQIDDKPDPVKAGTRLVYVLTVKNLGPNPASTLQLVDTLPSRVQFSSASPACRLATSAVTIPPVAGEKVICDPKELFAGKTLHVTIEVVVDSDAAGTSLVNKAHVTNSAGPDPKKGNNTATDTTRVRSRRG